MNFARRLQALLRRPKRDSETSETSITLEVKQAPDPVVTQAEAVNLPAVIFPDMDGATGHPIFYQTERQPVEQRPHAIFVFRRPPTPPPKRDLEKEGEEEEDAPLPLAPKILVDPNLQSILNVTAERSPTTTQREGSPQSVRFELADPPERPILSHKRLSAVSSPSWRGFPFVPLSKESNTLTRQSNITSTASAQSGDATVMNLDDQTENPFSWPEAGYPAGLLMEAEAMKLLRPFTEEEVCG